MATPFSYANSITAATPAVAAEVQDNFDDLLDWISAYYQQTADTTAEIAAAIAAQPGVLGTATQSAGIDPLVNGVVQDVPGLSVTFTAEATHLYKYSLGGVILALALSETAPWRLSFQLGPSGSAQLAHALFVPGSGTGAGYNYVNPCFVYQTGISGSTTVKGAIIWDSSTGSGNATVSNFNAVLTVEDLGVAP